MPEETHYPLVSVIIPSYNSAEFIGRTIHSVLTQGYDNFEIIIVDDSSEDETLKIVKQLSDKDNRINFYKIDHAGIPSIPRNFGIQKAKGELIAFLDSDDLWIKNKLRQQVKYFSDHPEIIFVYSISVTFGEVNIFSPYYEVLPLAFRAAHTQDDLIKNGNSIPLSTVLVRAEKLKEVKGFDEDPKLNIGEDYDLWLRLSNLGKFIFIPRIHAYYRIHKKQLSNKWETNKEKIRYLAEKRGLQLPEYKFYRKKNVLLRILRNLIHLSTYLWIKFISLRENRT